MKIEDIDIKQSCEYRWRMYHFKLICVIFAIIVSIMLVALVCSLPADFNPKLGKILAISLGVPFVIYLLVFAPFAIYYFVQANYLVKNYKSFSLHQVELTQIKTSYGHRSSNYYTVQMDVNGVQKSVDTSPMFSGAFFSPVNLEDYNNQKVWALYDQQKDKVYIVGK